MRDTLVTQRASLAAQYIVRAGGGSVVEEYVDIVFDIRHQPRVSSLLVLPWSLQWEMWLLGNSYTSEKWWLLQDCRILALKSVWRADFRVSAQIIANPWPLHLRNYGFKTVVFKGHPHGSRTLCFFYQSYVIKALDIPDYVYILVDNFRLISSFMEDTFCNEIFQEIMSDEVPENYERQKSRVSPVEEGLDPSSPPKKRCAKALTSMKKATEEDEFHLEALVKEKGEDDFIVEEVPSTSVVPCLKLIGPEVFNVDTKRELSKELHNLGEGYLRIFQLLEEMQGTLEFKKELVEYTIMEVKRLKAQDLVKQLEERLRTINKKLKKNKSQI